LREGDVMLVVGTSGVVYPAASLPEEALEKPGVHVIEINPVPSAISSRCVLRSKHRCPVNGGLH
jgi:NAD-dependent deacetylase